MTMANDKSDAAGQVQQILGAPEIIDPLREKMEQWLDEAQDGSKRECLENVVGHIGSIENSHQQRLAEARGRG
jgi:hypothetical protein